MAISLNKKSVGTWASQEKKYYFWDLDQGKRFKENAEGCSVPKWIESLLDKSVKHKVFFSILSKGLCISLKDKKMFLINKITYFNLRFACSLQYL